MQPNHDHTLQLLKSIPFSGNQTNLLHLPFRVTPQHHNAT